MTLAMLFFSRPALRPVVTQQSTVNCQLCLIQHFPFIDSGTAHNHFDPALDGRRLLNQIDSTFKQVPVYVTCHDLPLYCLSNPARLLLKAFSCLSASTCLLGLGCAFSHQHLLLAFQHQAAPMLTQLSRLESASLYASRD
jgi:hypothetical protein